MKNKWIALVAALCMLLSAATPAFGAEKTKEISLPQETKEHIKVKINGQEIKDVLVNIKEVQTIQEGKIYQIQLKELLGDGKLEVHILEGTVIDTSNLKN